MKRYNFAKHGQICMNFGMQTHLASIIFKMCQKLNRKYIQHGGGGHIDFGFIAISRLPIIRF